MTLLIRAAFLMIVLTSSRIASAQDAKIAVVDVQRLTVGSDEGKKATEKLDNRYKEISALMQKAQKDIEDKETKLKQGERLLSAAAKAALAKDIDTDKKTFARKNEDYQKEMTDLEEEVMAPVAQRAEATLAAYVKEKGYTILFNLAAENGTVVWFNRGNDVTDDVIKKMNSEARTVAAPAPAATPARPPASAPAAAAPATR